MTELGQSLQPVAVVSEAPAAGPALRVVGYTSAPVGRGVLGGPALPVYVVSDAEVAAGAPVAGNVPLPCVLASSLPLVPPTAGQRPIPVYVVGGSLNPAPPFPAGMAARWTLDDTSAGYADLVGGLVLAPVGTAPTSVPGVIGNAASCGGTGYLRTPDTTVVQGRAGFAIEVWVNFTAFTAFAMIAAKDGSSRDWLLYLTPGNAASFMVRDQGGATPEAIGAVLTLSTWHHLVGVIHSDLTLRLYRNGVLEGGPIAMALPPVIPSSVGMGIGGRDDAVPLPVDGRVDEPAVWQFGTDGDPGAAFWAARYNGGSGVRP